MLRIVLLSLLILYVSCRRLHPGRNLQDNLGGDANTLRFLVTYRDFLPANCAFALDDILPNAQFLVDEQLNAIGSEFNIGAVGCNSLAEDLVFQEFFLNAEIKGHPDFNIENQIGLFRNCEADDIIPVGTCRFEPENSLEEPIEILELFLEENTGGIPKPVYCQDDPEASCGFNLDRELGLRQQSQKKFFDSWYNDDIVFNKRIGQPLDLTRVGDTATFEFRLNDNDNPEGRDNTEDFFGPLSRFKNGDDRLEIDAFPDPRDFPAWPQSDSFDKGFFFTTELHTTFEFFVDQDMTFEFSGDDDFWAYVNGQMVIDLQGIHQSQTAQIDLNANISDVPLSEIIGLEDGQVYTLDIFHAERNIFDSNFEMTTTLNPACNVLQAGSVAVSLEGIGVSEEEFEELFTFSTVVEQLNRNSFSLASADFTFSSSFIFTNIAENVGRGFIATFDVEVDQATEGFAFVVQNRGNENYPLSFGSTFNFFGITNSFAVVFDYCTNRDDVDFNGDCDGQDVRVHHADSAEEPNNAGDETKKVFDKIIRSNGRKFNEFKVEIVFFGDSPDFLEVYIDDSLILREKDFDIEGILGNLGAFVGFTSSSGAQAANIVISNFVLQTVEVDATNSEVVSDDEDNDIDAGNSTSSRISREILGDGLEVGQGITFQTFDFCFNEINTGTLAEFANGVFIEELNETTGLFNNGSLVPNVETAIVLDNNDGSYTTTFTTQVAGSYEALVVFGEQCELEVEVGGQNEAEGTPGAAVITVVGDGCFFAEEPQATNVIEFIVEEPETEAELSEEDNNEDLSLVLLAVGGGCIILILFGAILFAVYRKKWKENAPFVEPGQQYLLELNTNVTGGEDYQAAGLAVLKTQKEILNLKAHAPEDSREGEIGELTAENENLKELITEAKKDDGQDPDVGRDSIVEPLRNNKDKVEF